MIKNYAPMVGMLVVIFATAHYLTTIHVSNAVGGMIIITSTLLSYKLVERIVKWF